MSRIKKTSPLLNLTNFQTFIVDDNPLSQYFKISELSDLLTSGKNGFLIEGSTFLKPSTEIKIEVLDVEGNPLYVEPGEGIPEYYEGLSKLISVHVYEDTPIGIGKITILGELEKWIDENGFIQDIPEDWNGIYNIKWERDIKINKNIPNETRVRFVRKPQVIIEELNESFYSRNLVNATQTTGTVRGIALTPSEGTSYIGYRGGVRYLIQNESEDFRDGATRISVTGTSLQDIEIVEYLNQRTLIIQVPFTNSNNVVSNFSGKGYSLSYQYNQNPIASSILGSFGRFEINHLQTFVGDVERVKVFKKSRASNVDYEVIQDTRVASAELLTTIVSGSNIDTGHFSASYEGGKSWNDFWVTQNLAGAELDSSKVYRAVKLQNNRLSTNLGDDIRLESGSEYALEFYNYYDTSSNDVNDTLKIYLTSTLRSGSGISNYYVTQSLMTFTGSNEFRSANKRVYNFVPPITDNWTVHFEADNTTANSYWHVGQISLQASHELGFSPDEFSFIIPVDRDLERETFDFKFEFFDINNNYVPINVISAKTFQSGNIGLIDKNIIVDVDKQFFNFSSSLEGLPPSQSISITGTKNRILGNLLITSQAFDTGGIEIPTSSYIGSEYPGRLDFFEQDLYSLSASLSIAKFTGSLHTSSIVDRITYTLTETESVQPFIKRFTISRLVAGASGQDGTDSKALFVSANTNQFIYEPTGPSLKPTGQIILIDVKKQNLVSGSTSPNLIINSSSNYPLTQVGSESGGVISFSLNGSGFPYSAGEVTYAFTGSDEFSNSYSDFVKITPVMNFDGVSVVLSNEATTFPAISTGVVTSSDLDTGDGQVFMRIGSNEIQHSDGLATGNRFDIVEITASGCTANQTSPTTNSYGISAMSDDSASLDMLIRYKAGDNSTTVDFRKIVSYTKAKKAAPVLEFVITNNNQSVDAKSTGEQISNFQTSSFSVREIYNGVSTIKNLSVAPTINSSSLYTRGTATATTLALPPLSNDSNSVELYVTGSVTDSESTSRTVFGGISLTKIKNAKPVVLVTATPQAQSVLANTAGVQTGTLSNVTINALEGTTSRFTSMTGTYSGFSTNPTISGNILTMTSAVMNAAEASATLTVTHTDSEGTTGQTQTIIVRATKVPTGAKGDQGDPGQDGADGTDGTDGSDGRRTATGLIYYQLSAASAPSTPSATSFTFSTGNFGGLTANWAKGAPTFAAGNSNKYWYSTYTAVETTAGGDTATPTFSTPVQAIGFTGLVTFTSANNISDGGSYSSEIIPKGSITNHIGGADVTTINGGKVSTGVITSTGYTLASGETLAVGGYTVNGTIINLDNGSIRSKNFYISSSGDSFFKGNITGASGTFGGSIRIGSGESVFSADSNGIYLGNETFASAEFRVTPAGVLTAASANITGTINATAGNFSGDITSTATITGGSIVGGTMRVGAIGYSGTIIDTTPFNDRSEDPSNANTITLGPGGMIFKGSHNSNNENADNYISLRVQDNYARMIVQSIVPGIEVMSVLAYPAGNQAALRVYNGGIYTSNFAIGDYNGLGNQGYGIICDSLKSYGAGTFAGDVTANTSDKRLKTNIKNIDSPLEKISKINGVYFNWNEEAKKLADKNTEIREVGFIAQEINEILPEIVKLAPFDTELDIENSSANNKIYKSKSNEDYLTIQYEKIVPLLVECIKELKSEIEELKKNKI